MADDRTDETLMLAYGDGDLLAFETLYRRHRGALYRFLSHNLRQRADTDELFRETWQQVTVARERYSVDTGFTIWLLRIACHLIAINRRRSRILSEPKPVEASSRAAEHPVRVLSDFERRRRLQLALEDLPEEQRITFLLRVENGRDVDEIGLITGVDRKTAESRLRDALQRIRARLAA